MGSRAGLERGDNLIQAAGYHRHDHRRDGELAELRKLLDALAAD